jgi:hypothetical protein
MVLVVVLVPLVLVVEVVVMLDAVTVDVEKWN